MKVNVKYIAKLILSFLLLALALTLFLTPQPSPYALVILSYTLGSIPFGYVLSRAALSKDIRTIGSGNIGATNVLRAGSKAIALLTLILDASKGAVAILWLSTYTTNEYMPYAIGIMSLLGHLFPIWLNFKGGKGVATGLGILLALSWPFALIALGLWMLIAFITRYSSLAALVTAGLLPGIAVLLGNHILAIFTFLLGVLIYIRHIENIKRLLAGKETKIGQRTKD